MLPWLQFAAVGGLAGGALATLDYARSALAGVPFHLTSAEHITHATLLFVGGYLAGLVGAVVLQVCSDIGRWVATRWNVPPQPVIAAVLATACSSVIVPVALALFQGRAIRQTNIASWGPWAAGALGFALCAATAWLIQRLYQGLEARPGARLRKAAIVALAGLLLAPLVYADLYLFYGLYGYLHAVLMALSFTLVALTAFLILGKWRQRSAQLAHALLIPCVPLLVYTAPRYDAALADFATHFAYTSRVIMLARAATDWDSDGYSNLLGHQDAAILDAAVRPLAREVPDNGIDDDGEFGDLSGTELEAARQKYARGQSAPARALYQSLRGGSPPNLLMITIDTLRADRVMPENHAAPASFAAFKRASVRFERAFASSSFTQASVGMLATSHYDTSRAKASLFDALHDAGCTTLLAFSETPFRILDDSRPNVVQSFDQRAITPDRDPGDLGMFHAYAATRPTSGAIVKDALELLAANRDKRTCTWVYLFDVHQWQELQDPDVVGATSAGPERYDHAVQFVLRHVAELLDGLQRLGLAEQTVVLLSGDHGEALGEKGIVGHTSWVHNPWLHVPLLIRAPGLEPRVVADAEVGLIDVAPTLLDLLGVEPDLGDLDGTSLLPLMLGQPLQHLVFAHEENYDAVFGDGHKLVIDRPEGRYRLYDLDRDYAEESSVFDAPGHTGVARELYLAYQAQSSL